MRLAQLDQLQLDQLQLDQLGLAHVCMYMQTNHPNRTTAWCSSCASSAWREYGEILAGIDLTAISARPGGQGRQGPAAKTQGPHTFFLWPNTVQQKLTLDKRRGFLYAVRMKSIPLTVREVRATEAVLDRIYANAKLGLKGRSLALACDLRPEEYRRLCELDPTAELAEFKGRADAEKEMSSALYAAARAGDAKAALEILRHQHDWVAKQQVQIDVAQQISIVAALEQAQRRVTEVIEDARTPLLSGSGAGADVPALVPADRQRS